MWKWNVVLIVDFVSIVLLQFDHLSTTYLAFYLVVGVFFCDLKIFFNFEVWHPKEWLQQCVSCCSHCSLTKNNSNTSLHSRLSMVDLEKIDSLCPRPSSFWTTDFLYAVWTYSWFTIMIPLPSPKVMGREWWWGKNLTSSLWTISMNYPNGLPLSGVCSWV